MATPAEELKAAKDLYDLKIKSAKLSASERANFAATAADIKNTGDDINRWNTLLSSIVDITDSLRDSLTYIASSFKDSVNDLQKQNVYLNAQKSALNKLADIATKTLNIRRGESELDTKKLAKLRLETTEKIRQLEFSKRQHDANTIEGALALKGIDNQILDAHELYKAFDEVLKVNKAFNKELGLSPGIAAGLDKALQKIGMPSLGISEALSETKMLHQEAESTGQSINLWKTFSGKVSDNFKGIFTKTNLLQAGIGLIVDALITADKATGDLAKSFNITYDSAAALRNELIQIGNESGNVALNARALQESMIAVGQSLGSNAKLNTEDLKTFTELREMAEYTNEELVGIQKLTLATGGNLKDNTKQFLGTVAALNAQNKLTVNEKQLLKEVANTSAAIKLSVGGTTEGLAKAAFQAKKFGINLEQADKIASSLLDFESSISNELEAELLTGKDLNLERARLLALNGDIAGASAEILKQVKGSAEFTKMNRIQQESLAKAVGMGREELAASLIEREALNKLGVKDAAAAKEKFDLLVKEKGYAAAVAEMGDEQYANQLKQQSIQERMNKSVEKMKELFVSIAEPVLEILSPLMDLVTAVLPPIMGLLQPVLGAFKAIAHTVAGIVKLLTLDFKGAMSSFGSIGEDLIGGVTSSTQFKVGKSIVSSMSDEKSESQTKFAEGGLVMGEINNATIGEAGPEIVLPLNSPKTDKYLNNRNTNNNPTPNNINSNVDVKVSAGNTILQLDGVAIAKTITKYVVDEINKNGVVIA